MIMPCMNSMSACERCGVTADVLGGSFLLGFPGAPGCTTETEPDAACWAWPAVAGQLQSTAAIVQLKNASANLPRLCGLRQRSARSGLNFRIRSGIFAAHTLSRRCEIASAKPLAVALLERGVAHVLTIGLLSQLACERSLLPAR